MATKIIDIRTDTAESDILADIKKGLRPESGGEKKLPTLLLSLLLAKKAFVYSKRSRTKRSIT